MKIILSESQLKNMFEDIASPNIVDLKPKVVDSVSKIIGYPGKGTHSATGWYNNNAWDVASPIGSKVYSIYDGVVTKVNHYGDSIVKDGVKKLFGDGITIKSKNGMIYYAHLKSAVTQGQKVSAGDVIGYIMAPEGMTPHVHVGLQNGELLKIIQV
jgi:hypothetical protein